jgi:hypothetical protein
MAYESVDEMSLMSIAVDIGKIEDFLLAIADRSDCPEPRRFGQSQEMLDLHFACDWSDDYPSVRVIVEYENGSSLELFSNSNHAHLLPWAIKSTAEETETFNPQVSVCLALLMPQGFLFRERLIDSLNDFERDRLLHESIGDPLESEVSGDGVVMPLEHPAQSTKKLKYSPSKLGRLSEQELLGLKATGYDLSSADDAGQTALMDAAFPPFNKDKFRKLVRVGVNLNARRSDGMTGLMLACAGGDEEAVAEWLNAGAEVNLRGPDDCTALMLGAKYGNIVESLLAHGARAADKDKDGGTALEYSLNNLSVMFVGKRLKAVELIAECLSRSSPDALQRSYERAMDLSRKTRLEIEILHAMGRRTMWERIKDSEVSAKAAQSLDDISHLIDLEISEVELIDRIVEIIHTNIQHSA